MAIKKVIPKEQIQAFPPDDPALHRLAYGAIWRPYWNRQKKAAKIENWELELQMCQRAPDGPGESFGNCPKGHKGFEYHFKKLVSIVYGTEDTLFNFTWNPNAERMMTAFLKHRRLGVLGSASSGKSRFMAMLAATLFFVYGKRVKILVTSTTLGASKGKIWGEVKLAWQQLAQYMGDPAYLPGRIIESDSCIRYELNGVRIDGAGVQLVASEQGSDKDSSAKIQGTKAYGGFLVVLADELDTLNDSLMGTVNSNLASNERSRFMGPFNPTKRSSIAGRFVTPLDGWSSVTEEGPMEWECVAGAYAIRFDALQSPNVLAGKTLWPGLPTIQSLKNIETDNGGKDTPGYWRDVRGWFSPIGVSSNIYSENEIIAYKADKKETAWIEKPTLVAGFDTAYGEGGDECALVIGKMGTAQRVKDGKAYNLKVCETSELIIYHQNMRDSTSKEEQIARQFKKTMEEERFANPTDAMPLRIENVNMDITGGGNIAPLIARDVGQMMRTNFKSKPSDKPVSLTDSRKAEDRFHTKRDELWVCPRELIRGGQIRGMIPEITFQLTEATYVDEGSKGKIKVEAKAEFSKRLKCSPDKADAWVLMVDVCRQKFGLSSIERALKTPKPGCKFIQMADLMGNMVDVQVRISGGEDVFGMDRFKKGYRRPESETPAMAMEFDGGTWQ